MSSSLSQRSVIAVDESPSGSPASTIRMSSNESGSKVPKSLPGTDSIFKEAMLISEYSLVAMKAQEKLCGLYVIPTFHNPNVWFGVLFVHEGPYIGGVFRFTLKLPDKFPESTTVPIVSFQPPVFHPCVHPTRGYFDLRSHFKSWSKGHQVWQVLKVIRNSFYKIELSTFNKSAHDMFENKFGEFLKQAQLEAENSVNRIYEIPPEYSSDPHWIKFSPYDPRIHDSIRAKILKPPNRRASLHINNVNITPNNKTSRGTSFIEHLKRANS